MWTAVPAGSCVPAWPAMKRRKRRQFRARSTEPSRLMAEAGRAVAPPSPTRWLSTATGGRGSHAGGLYPLPLAPAPRVADANCNWAVLPASGKTKLGVSTRLVKGGGRAAKGGKAPQFGPPP